MSRSEGLFRRGEARPGQGGFQPGDWRGVQDSCARGLLAVLLIAHLVAAGCVPLPVRVAAAAPSQSSSAPHEAVKIALIDTGVRVGRLPEGASVEPGRNYAFEDKDTTDLVGHGTRIAGILLGIAPDVTLVPLVYYSQYPSGVPVNGGIAAISRAIYDAIDVYGCQIVNVSSGVSADDAVLREAVDYAEEKGVIVVSAAGNDRLTAPTRLFYPAAYDTVVGVGAVAASLDIAAFSQVNRSVTVVAPGKDLQVLSIGGSESETVSGTSYATAYVAAHAALLVSAYPGITPAEFRELLRVSSQDLGDPGYDETFGWGYVEACSPSGFLAYERMLHVKALPFSDVSPSDWHCDAVLAVYENDLMLGESPTLFGVDSPATWEMLATVLHRFHTLTGAGSAPGVTSHVGQGEEHGASMDWAIRTGVFDLSSAGVRSGPVTRERLCAVLVDYCRYAGIEWVESSTSAKPAVFSDIGRASDWAVDYITAAQAAGLVRGDGDGLFRPADAASRAELATLILRLLRLLPS